jgi:hypothetical protein
MFNVQVVNAAPPPAPRTWTMMSEIGLSARARHRGAPAERVLHLVRRGGERGMALTLGHQDGEGGVRRFQILSKI